MIKLKLLYTNCSYIFKFILIMKSYQKTNESDPPLKPDLTKVQQGFIDLFNDQSVIKDAK